MTKVFSEVKVFLRNSYQFSYNRRNPKSTGRKLITPILIFLIAAYIMFIFGFLSYKLISILTPVHQAALFLGVFLLVIALLVIVQTVFSALNIFYFSKDITYILPLPIKPWQIVTAKLITLLVSEYIVELAVAAAPVVVYGVLTSAGASFYLCSIIVFLLFPIFPAVIACLLIMLLMVFSKFAKSKDMFQVGVAIVAIAIIMGLQIVIQNSIKLDTADMVKMLQSANGLVSAIGQYFLTIMPAVNMLTGVNVGLSFLELFGITVGSAILYIALSQKLYFIGAVGNATGNSRKAVKINENKAIQSKKISYSYIMKEIKTLYRNPIFFMQCVLPIFLIPVIFGVMYGVIHKKAITALQGMDTNTLIFTLIVLTIVQFLFAISATSVTAVSREGTNAVFTKYIPLSYYKQFGYKLVSGILISVLSIIIGVVFVSLLIGMMSFGQTVMILLVSLVLAFLQNYLMLIVDLKHPKLLWDSEYAVMKQNFNMIFEFAFLFVIGGIVWGLWWIFPDANQYLLLSIIFAAAAVVLVLVDRYVKRNQVKLFEKIM